jgi:hypothetical protein
MLRRLIDGIWLVLFAAFVLGYVYAIALASLSPPKTAANYIAQKQTNQSSASINYCGFKCAWHWVFPDSISLFNLLLVVFTALLAVVAYKQVRLARDEFIATHRPKIIVHAVEISRDDGGEGAEEKIGASVIYFNVGDTPAQIVAINAKISRYRLPLQSGLGVGIGIRLTPLPVPKDRIVGGPHFIAIFSAHTFENERFVLKAAQDNGRDGACMCIGQIVYEDGRGVRRETGFCRRLDVKDERWTKIDNPEYEYAY